MPLVTQYGRTLRLSAEIVDPQRGRTVWVQTSDADGSDSALKAMDRLLRGLRENLGESLAQIQTTAQPLEQVSTPNLEALQAYTQALYLVRQGDYEQAENALIHATELDPKFAAAYAFMGSVLYSQERWPEARAALERAMSIEGRLTERTRIYSWAILAHFTDPRSALSLWQMHTNQMAVQPDRARRPGFRCGRLPVNCARIRCGVAPGQLEPCVAVVGPARSGPGPGASEWRHRARSRREPQAARGRHRRRALAPRHRVC